MPRKTNKAGIELIKHFEGLHTEAYLCPANVWTIGYGHTQGVRKGQVITEAEAEQFLIEDLSSAESSVERLIACALNENQFAALVSFTFNLGAGNLKTSTLRRKLNGGDYDAVPSELARWVKAGGKTLPGLVRRRAAEGELFVTSNGDEGTDESRLMPQRVDSIGGRVREHIVRSYLTDTVDLAHGSVDDTGDERYVRLSQNVPDGYVISLQEDLRSLGYGDEVGEADGAFGNATEGAVLAFQQDASIETHGVVDGETRAALAEWLEHGFSRSVPPGADEEGLSLTQQDFTLIAPRIPHFSQGDTRWAGRTLGRDSSIKREGCAIACIAMILRYYDCNVDPLKLDAYLDANEGYVRNSVKWNVAASYSKRHGGPELSYSRKTGTIAELSGVLKRRIERNQPTMVRVDYGVDGDLKYNHFVVCVGRTSTGDFIMNDPSTHRGDAYVSPDSDNIIQRTTRKNGYTIVQLDYYDRKKDMT
jgi:lysozyme